VELVRLYGYAIEPQRLTAEDLFNEPLGGSLPVRKSLRVALDNSLRTAEKSGKMTDVTLRLNEDPEAERTCPVRDAIMSLAFKEPEEAAKAALFLATQLSRAMDERSPECLLLIAGYSEENSEKHRVAAWVFPQDEAFRFTPGHDGNDIELLTEIFSRTSALRKMALFEGKNLPTQFGGARALDYQTGRSDDVAGFWIQRFLEARLAITAAAGTKVLADALKRASDADLTPEENQQVHAAALAIHTMPQTHWSLEEVANSFLTGKARDVFLSTAENEATRTSTFELDRPALQRGLSYRNFQLPNNVWVSAPIEEVGDGKTVSLEDAGADVGGEGGPREVLKIEANVVRDRLGSRRV
jgi:37-kD nucleoid-associated bacterial protein